MWIDGNKVVWNQSARITGTLIGMDLERGTGRGGKLTQLTHKKKREERKGKKKKRKRRRRRRRSLKKKQKKGR